MRFHHRIVLDLLMPRALNHNDDMRSFIDIICRSPLLTPVKFDGCQPIRKIFDPHDFDAIQDVAKFGLFIWIANQRNISCSLNLRHGLGGKTSSMNVLVEPGADVEPSDLCRVFRDVAMQFGAIFGYIHIVVPQEVERARLSGTVILLPGQEQEPYLAIGRKHLKHFVPDLYWATIFGPQYVELFGRDRVASCNAFVVDEIACDVFYLQSSEEIIDVSEKWALVAAERQRLKEHLGSDVVFAADLGQSNTYRVPALPWKERL